MACKTPRKITKLYKIDKITSKISTRWKIKATVRIQTDTEEKKSWRNKNGEGQRFAVIFQDDSGEIRGVAFGKIAEELESEFENNKEYYITGIGADINVANKDYKKYHKKYEFKFQRKPLIEPVDVPSQSQDSGISDTASSSRSSHTASSSSSSHTASLSGSSQWSTGSAVRKPVHFDPVNVKEIHGKPKPSNQFDILGVVKKLSKADFRYDDEEKFYVKDIDLMDSTGEVTIGITTKKQKDLDFLKGVNDQIIGVIGCVWKVYGKKAVLTADKDHIYLESQVPESAKSQMEKLKEWHKSKSKKASITPKDKERKEPSADTCSVSPVNLDAKQQNGSSSPESGTEATTHETRGVKRSHEEKENGSSDCKCPHNSEDEIRKWNFKMFKKLTKIGRDALQIYFDSVIFPQNLEQFLIDNKPTMEYGQHKMSPEQMQVLFPGDSVDDNQLMTAQVYHVC
ncbi:replication protein A 70 kDa DNA-binding subunit-like [Saccostrea cucullata]|uniref:replication protein A 70 kDa DNA-binding subunit-like n=1 Tax=Saccostrea cuccullata TaxID=36930 RepID=UPI002ED0F83E